MQVLETIAKAGIRAGIGGSSKKGEVMNWLRNNWLAVGVVITAVAILVYQVKAYLDTPIIYFSYSTGKPVLVESPSGQHYVKEGEALPANYEKVWRR